MPSRYGRHLYRAAEAAETRAASEEALTWLDFAAGVAAAASDTDAVNRMTARLLESAGVRESRTSEAAAGSFGAGVTDRDLTAGV